MQSGPRDHAEALYYHIAGDAIGCAKRESDEFGIAQYVCTAMVFSALTLEAYINQQYASHPETKKLDLRKLEVREKWKMLPLLLGSKTTFDTGAPPFQKFNNLINLRNEALVHFNPIGKAQQSGSGRKRFSTIVKDLGNAKLYFACIRDMIEHLYKLTSGKTDVPEFLNGARYISTITVDMRASIEILASSK